MESLISDKDAMDPEVVVGGGDKSPARLWQGLPQSWALATFIVCSVAVTTWSCPECVAGLTVAALVISLRGSCSTLRQTGGGAWLLLLHQCCHLAGVVVGVRTTLQYMAGHSSWLTKQLILSPHLASLGVLLFIITLHILGLERSRILRWGLLSCVPITLSLFLIGDMMLFSPERAKLIYDELPTLSNVANSAAFFTLVYSTSLSTYTPREKITVTTLFPVKTMFVSCFFAIGFLTLGLVEARDNSLSNELLFFQVLTEWGSGAWRMLRGGLAVVCLTSLSLSLVEVVGMTQRGVVGVAGLVLPPQVARDHWWTGTQLTALSITGLVSAVLLVLPLKSQISLSSAAYLLSQSCDIVFTIYSAYQPSFVPKNNGSQTGRVSYQLVSDTAALVEDTDSDSELSDDSGHSSDTDIDAAVHEYKQTVKVARTRTIEEPNPSPTVRSARITILSLFAISSASVGMAAALAFNQVFSLAFTCLGILFFTHIISKQPQETDEQGLSVLSPWQPCLVLALHLTLAALLLPQLWAPLIVWVCIGLVLWLVQKRRHWWHIQTQLSRHAHRVRLPRPQLAQNFLTSYHKLSTLNTVHVVR
ncbi:uncharacterized protein LOC129002241 [Macrosteles quadrilineatus]|uniref:uncharacterized protein LOC129002241 n=1 Tax=Macrosteles quadrilineatus TaxID=74068 RepID=UPI0023E16358|nr:uncharacterized protein LOC129002241 [Macrosteles quadrilineatus]XP_054285880.1 uncharacterized protein LOC129002241 [Macrosteles quadrilineatus]